MTRFAPSGSQIQPIIVGADTQAVALAASLQARGYDIRAIRPPTVPEGYGAAAPDRDAQHR